MADAGSPVDGCSGSLLRQATDGHGRTALGWAADPLLDARRVLDLCCGTGAMADELPVGRWFGVDREAGPGRPRLRALPTALPLRRSSVDGICLLLALPRLPDVDGVFAELRRVLRPGGTLVLLVPSAESRSTAELRMARVLRSVHRGGWRNRSALDRAGWLLAAADFALLADERISFTLPMPDAGAVLELVTGLPVVGLWPDLSPDVRDRLAGQLMARAGPGRVLPVPMRRLVARR